MKKLGVYNYSIISEALKITGSYNWEDNAYIIEERLLVNEYDTVVDFLNWVSEGGTKMMYGMEVSKRAFGRGNYEERFKEYLDSRLGITK